MKRLGNLILIILTMIVFVTLSCQEADITNNHSIVVTYSILGSVVKELVGDNADVTVSIPNGLDPHEWEPSARSIKAINKAALVIWNGLGLEEGMKQSLEAAQKGGVKIFTASDHIAIRHVGTREGIPSDDPDQAVGAPDPHLWTDPITMKAIVKALVPILKKEMDIDVSDRARDLESRLDALDKEVAGAFSALPSENRKLVTGHESMGYFSQRYDLRLIGVIVPSLSSQAGVSAANLSALKNTIVDNHVKAIFTELGTSPAIAKAISDETGVEVVELGTHSLPEDGSYFTYVKNMADTIINALR